MMFRYLPQKIGFSDDKITFFMIKNGFPDPKLYPPTYFGHFYKKKNFLSLIFVTSFER